MQRSTYLLVFLLACGVKAGMAGDWPMWRHDAARTGVSPEALSSDLRLHWVRQLPEPRPAWPESQEKLQFDLGYEPVVLGRRMFVGSSRNDTVTAYSTDTGEELWRFYTDGPVRFAPAAIGERVYAVSDDGHLYCLSAADGSLVWKVNGGPRQRPVIGNDRLVSTWPARGGVVVQDGVAYFTAGIWPSMGVFVRAVDAASGRVLWTNSEISSVFVTHPHGADSFGSISPQGHLALLGDDLLVPGGRTLPGVFDRKTGRLKHFNFGGKGDGGHDVMAAGDYFVVANELFRLSDGALVGSFPASVAGRKRAIGAEANGRSIVVTSLAGSVEEKTVTDRRGRPQKQVVFTPESTRKFAPSMPGQVFLQAGETIFTAGDGRIAAYDLPSALQRTADVHPHWIAFVDGEAWTMLAADDRLFAVTRNARLYCFGPGARQPVEHGLDVAELEPAEDASVREAVQTLASMAGTGEGYAVAWGDGRPGLVRELLRQTNFQVIALDGDAGRVDALRRDADAAGLYGTRFAAHVADPRQFELPPYLASLLVCDNAGDIGASEISAMFAVLRPYGGAACLRTSAARHQALVEAVRSARLENAEITRQGEWTVLKRAGALPESGVWTHQYGDSANSVVSRDKRVKAPLGVLWFGGPPNDKVLPRHGHGPAPQVAGGRLFIEGPDMLRAVDVYNGRVWWERELPGLGKYYDNTAHHPGANEIGSNYVSLEDHVYVVYGADILELDAATGRTTREFSINSLTGRAEANWGGIAVHENLLVATADPVVVEGTDGGNQATVPPGHKAIIAPHAKWRYLAGSDAPANWASPGFQPAGWKTGEVGIGYSDNDDRTELKDMAGRYTRVYILNEFDARAVENALSLTLMINFDDAFIASLNGTEVLRVGVGKGSGAGASDLDGHEADGYESFEIRDFRKLIRPDRNVLAIEGHNDGPTSSDFSLDPYLIARVPSDGKDAAPPKLTELFQRTPHSAASRELIVFDRNTGTRLWSRSAEYNFRHNTVCVADGKVFCIDALSPQKLDQLRRRGVQTNARARLLALDARTGEVLWSTDEDVFGTFLNYSAEHDVLVQGGSAYRDRAKDEVDRGLVAYRGSDGEVLWKNRELQYNGPCLLWRDKLITNGAEGFQLELLTGEPTGWEYRRMYGCNTVTGSEHLLTFRSGAAGFFDLTGESGTGNLGGFRSSCTSNLVVADGVLSAPDYTRTCSCAYQLQTSLAFVHMPEAEFWTFNVDNVLEDPRQAIGLNLGAPGDRRDDDGVLWLDYPAVGGPSPEIKVSTDPATPTWFTQHSSLVPEGDLKWVAASGARGLRSLTWALPPLEATKGTVRLVFAEPDGVRPGERLFSVSVQGREVLRDFDMARESGSEGGSVVKEFGSLPLGQTLTVTLSPASGAARQEPVLCGIAVIPE
jgi:outer membrane protein assembly factor BamB